jgi:hypothetical protein
MPRGVSPRKRAEWRERIERFSSSELSVPEFCQQERVSPSSFHRWRKKLDSPSDVRASHCLARASFVPVEVAGSNEIEVSFPNGVRLALPVSDLELLRLSIHAIAQAPTDCGGA